MAPPGRSAARGRGGRRRTRRSPRCRRRAPSLAWAAFATDVAANLWLRVSARSPIPGETATTIRRASATATALIEVRRKKSNGWKRRAAPVPIGDSLVGGAGGNQLRLTGGGADELEPDRQTGRI